MMTIQELEKIHAELVNALTMEWRSTNRFGKAARIQKILDALYQCKDSLLIAYRQKIG